MFRPPAVSLFALALLLPSTARAQGACPVPLYASDASGRVTGGSKKALVDAAMRGDPLRVGWRIVFGKGPQEFVQHWHDAPFVTVFEGEVFTQVPVIHRQSPVRGKRHVVLSPEVQHWSASLGSNGILVGRFSDGTPPSEVHVAQTWCLAAAACRAPEWTLVYRHDADGRAKSGSKAALLAAVRRGDPVRLAWGAVLPGAGGAARSVEHSADPVFVSIASGGEVYAQLAEHLVQSSYWERGKAAFDDPLATWRGVLGTDGSFDAATVDRATGKTVRRMPQRAGIAWFAFSSDSRCDERRPLDLATPGGVRRAYGTKTPAPCVELRSASSIAPVGLMDDRIVLMVSPPESSMKPSEDTGNLRTAMCTEGGGVS